MNVMNNVIIVNKESFEKKKAEFKKGGQSKIHILTDFDRTLTKAFSKGKKVPSFISKLRNGNYISKEYSEKANELYNKYHSIEISQNIDTKEKSAKMLEWWTSHYRLLVKSGLNREIIERAVDDMIKDKDITLREKAREFLKLLDEKNIPLVIISSSGLGNALTDFLEKQNSLFNNIHFIGNTLEFDEKGKFIGIKDNKIIHILNKNEAGLKDTTIYKQIKERKNILLLGDSLADLKMLEGADYLNLIKIGFFNYPDEENLEDFKKNFDIIITGDGGFDSINKLMKEILE